MAREASRRVAIWIDHVEQADATGAEGEQDVSHAQGPDPVGIPQWITLGQGSRADKGRDASKGKLKANFRGT